MPDELIPKEAYIAIGSIIAASIIGLINYTKIILAKEDEITQMRMRWIKDLSTAIAKLCAELELLVRLVECKRGAHEDGLDRHELSEFRKTYKDHYKNLNEAFYTAHIQLDPKKNKNIIEILNKLYNAFYDETCANLIDVRKIQMELMIDSQILSEEISQEIRKGDSQSLLYRNALKYTGLALFFFFIIWLSYYMYIHIDLEWQETA